MCHLFRKVKLLISLIGLWCLIVFVIAGWVLTLLLLKLCFVPASFFELCSLFVNGFALVRFVVWRLMFVSVMVFPWIKGLEILVVVFGIFLFVVRLILFVILELKFWLYLWLWLWVRFSIFFTAFLDIFKCNIFIAFLLYAMLTLILSGFLFLQLFLPL